MINGDNVSNDYKRNSDSKIDELISLVKEIHQRQIERTIPAVERIENDLYDKEVGLCVQVTRLRNTVGLWKSMIAATLSLIALGIAFVEFIFKHH
jgi:hypothetical protein